MAPSSWEPYQVVSCLHSSTLVYNGDRYLSSVIRSIDWTVECVERWLALADSYCAYNFACSYGYAQAIQVGIEPALLLPAFGKCGTQ